ncbi:hypothetical protein AB0K48_50925 [Nonomuraea sp. NPDC055795]
MMPITYYPIPTQDLFRSNAERIKGKPYAKYFNGDLWLHDEVLPQLKKPMDEADILPKSDLNTLLDPGYHRVETGFGATKDNDAYVTSLVRYPGCRIEMFTWWFWWHSVEPERYSLWYPFNHDHANPRNRDALTQPGLTDAERYIGNTHDIVEYVGPTRAELVIEFHDAGDLGIDSSRIKEPEYSQACGIINDKSWMIHLPRATEDGFELRSRYYFDKSIATASSPGDTAHNAALSFAYEMVIHDQTEFTHLSTFLADIYHEFGPNSA